MIQISIGNRTINKEDSTKASKSQSSGYARRMANGDAMLGLELSPELKAAFQDACRTREDRSMSYVLKKFMERYISEGH